MSQARKIGSSEEIRDITEWDSVNWGKAIKYLDQLNLNLKDKRVLELGSRNGGMSLFFAGRGGVCVCTDLSAPGKRAKEKHAKWNVQDRVTYESVDATSMPQEYENAFDIVTFKSVLGGIGRYENTDNEKKTVSEIKRVLKENGTVVLIENMKASHLHGLLRRVFRKHGRRWHYQTDNNIEALFRDFKLVAKKHYGFWGLFGFNERMRRVLGTFDSLAENLLPEKWKYVGVFVFEKTNDHRETVCQPN